MKHLTSFARFVAGIAILIAIALPTSASHAISGSGDIVIDCLGVFDNGSSFTTDRDNTGTKEEAYSIIGTDGAGVTLFSFSSTLPIGFTGSFGSEPWDTPPTANPLTLRFISHAGNGLPEQIVFSITGECAGLPYINGVSGPPIPDGFTLRTVTCDVSLFSIAGDLNTSITGARLINGQTWYMAAKTVKGADGKAWRQVFTSNTEMGYIPESCVK